MSLWVARSHNRRAPSAFGNLRGTHRTSRPNSTVQWLRGCHGSSYWSSHNLLTYRTHVQKRKDKDLSQMKKKNIIPFWNMKTEDDNKNGTIHQIGCGLRRIGLVEGATSVGASTTVALTVLWVVGILTLPCTLIRLQLSTWCDCTWIRDFEV